MFVGSRGGTGDEDASRGSCQSEFIAQAVPGAAKAGRFSLAELRAVGLRAFAEAAKRTKQDPHGDR